MSIKVIYYRDKGSYNASFIKTEGGGIGGGGFKQRAVFWEGRYFGRQIAEGQYLGRGAAFRGCIGAVV